jgi:hypothetical protein
VRVPRLATGDAPWAADLRQPTGNSLARRKKLQWNSFPTIELPTQQPRTGPRVDSGGDEHTG